MFLLVANAKSTLLFPVARTVGRSLGAQGWAGAAMWAVAVAAAFARFAPNAAAQAPVATATGDNAEPEPQRVVVTDRLISTDPDESGFDLTALDRAALESAPARRLDDILREQAPGFSLFRRSSSQVANPTTQGVSLRNVGPNGAGRTLVLLDGIPQNDPFGGWVYWNRLPAAGLERVEILQGGGAGLFGNAALGGTIAITSRQLADDALSLEVTGGSRETYETSATGQETLADGKLTLTGWADRFSTDGYPTLRADQRGRVDVPAFSEDDLLDLGARWQFDDANALTLRASGFREDRGNGTPRTNNHTQAADFSAAFAGEAPGGSGLGYQARVYGQLREYSQYFTSVSADRRTETPSLDQYAVPAQAVGGSLTAGLPLGETNRLLGGFDARHVDGETRERFRFLDGEFTRRRVAGGEQLFFGAFAEDAWKPTDRTTLTAAGRIDYYANTDGSRRETSLQDGSVTLDERFADRDGWEPDARLGISQELSPAARLRGAVYSGFRVPTLNELYRPFRVRNDITEANAALVPERLYGAEVGAEADPTRTLHLSAGGFYNALNKPVANVTVAQGPATVAPFGVIPAGGVGRLRENLGRATVYGAELAAAWTPTPEWRLTMSYLYTHTEVTDAPAQPSLEGKRLAQAPEHQLTAGARWTPFAHWQFDVQMRFVGDQYEDDLNTLSLDAYATVDAAVSWEFAHHWRARLSAENLFNTEYETGKTADGLVSIGAPRLVDFSLRWDY